MYQRSPEAERRSVNSGYAAWEDRKLAELKAWLLQQRDIELLVAGWGWLKRRFLSRG
jgi:hypothetical protein